MMSRRPLIAGNWKMHTTIPEATSLAASLADKLSGVMDRDIAVAPIFCVGKTLVEREKILTFTVLEKQVQKGLSGVVPSDPTGLVVAYEPVWAIDTGKTATEKQAEEVHSFMRGLLDRLFTKDIASHLDKVDKMIIGGAMANTFLKFQGFDVGLSKVEDEVFLNYLAQ